MNHTEIPYVQESRFALGVVDVFIALTGVSNIVTNSLILYGLIKTKLFRPVYILIFHIAVLDIIGQFFCPTVFKLFAGVDDIFRDFRSHAIFTGIYFIVLYLITLLMFILLLRVHLNCVDRNFKYVLGSYWVLAVIIAIFVMMGSYYIDVFLIPPYLVILAVLLIYVHIHQIRTTLKFDEYSGVDYQVSVLIVLTFISSRLIAILFFLLGEITYRFVPILGDYYILGILQLLSIANLLIIMKFEEGFYNNIRCLFRKRRSIGDNFRPLQEDHGIPE